ncbi:tRNA wybutosine-synthesizing protein 2 homolog [Electrophorus electricus]|uniref:tRNA wybutosine-synthesizing protein 2 homolog n=1 Tax=Electrophorus electricus TaxID=8005 RepID=A0A4W4GGR9_ELEEL|nr:tRNA wybutosine-synthesizing protein 2 homolog [Electrophorus electricus]
MDCIYVLQVPQRYAQLYRKHLLSSGVLDLQYCLQKHSNGTVTLPVRPSALPRLDLRALQDSVAQGSSCELFKTQVPCRSKKGKARSCRESIVQSVQMLLAAKGKQLNKELEDDIPNGYQRHGDLVLFSEGCFSQAIWREIGSELWLAVASALGVKRVAQMKRISQDGYRTPTVTILLGDSSYVTHIDNHIRYEFDVTKCMFSFGNITEKLRIASFDCTGETVVDLYAGIGYFTLPYLVHANAAHVHACEWNPDAAAALRTNLQLNKVANRCTVHEGDNRQLSLSDLADRVNLGLLPSSEEGWPVACRLLRRDVGGIMHIHHNITTPLHRGTREESDTLETASSEEEEEQERAAEGSLKHLEIIQAWNAWAHKAAGRIGTLLRDITMDTWITTIKRIEHVKSYAPHVSHIVLDLECKPAK